MNIDRLQSILASEIECEIFEKYVLPALDTARKAVANVPDITDEQIESAAALYSLDLYNGLDWCFDDMNLKFFVRAILNEA